MWDKEDVISEKGGKVGCEVRVVYYCQLISVNRLNDVGIDFTTFKNCNIGALHMLEGVLRFYTIMHGFMIKYSRSYF